MRCRVLSRPRVVGFCLGILTVASPLARAAPGEAGVVIDGSGIDDPSRDPPEPGDDGQGEDAGAERALRVPCLEELSAEGEPRKGVQVRPFLKKHRFEVSALGGLYASDVLSSTYVAGGALGFFLAEDFGLELLVTRNPVEFRLEEPYTAFDRLNRFPPGAAWSGLFSLLYAPLHAKFKFSEDSIVTGDILIIAGAGRTFHDSVQGLTWKAGLGFKLYLSRLFTLRFDIRDLIAPQEVLGRAHVTNNIVVMGGLSLWLL